MSIMRRGLCSGMLVVMAGCGESLSVDEPAAFDAGAVNANFARLDGVFGSAVWQSFDRLGPIFATSRPMSRGAGSRAAAATAAPRIPDDLRGITYVLKIDPLRYEPDPERADAPSDGFRIVLYAVNPFSGTPVPTTEIGHLDLVDRGDETPTGIALQLTIVSGGTTWVEYDVTADGDDTSGQLGAAGFVAGPEAQIDFDIAADHRRGPDSSTGTLTFAIEIAAHRFSADAAIAHTDGVSGPSGSIDLDLLVDDTRLAFDADNTEHAVDAEVRVDDGVFATIRGHPVTPEIRNARGDPVTPEEAQALGHIMALQGRVFEMFDNLMQPVGPIVELQIVP